MKKEFNEAYYAEALEKIKGQIKLTLRNDFVAHYVFFRAPEALKGLICSVMGFSPSEVKSVRVMNPINYGEYLDKLIILDIKVDLNDSEYIDIELQVYTDKQWVKRSLLYLCRTYNEGIGRSEDYKKLRPTTIITITDRDLGLEAEKHNEFLAEYIFKNVKTNEKYSDLLRIKILYLNNLKFAKQEDFSSGLVFWAKMFIANNWEEIIKVSKEGEGFMEAAKELYNANTISEERTIMEAHGRYISMRDGMKEYYEDLLEESKRENEENKRELEKNRRELEEKDRENEELRKTIELLQNKLKQQK